MGRMTTLLPNWQWYAGEVVRNEIDKAKWQTILPSRLPVEYHVNILFIIVLVPGVASLFPPPRRGFNLEKPSRRTTV